MQRSSLARASHPSPVELNLQGYCLHQRKQALHAVNTTAVRSEFESGLLEFIIRALARADMVCPHQLITGGPRAIFETSIPVTPVFQATSGTIQRECREASPQK
eukprot:INCI7300.1.p1 GENE.INCI7300.1~~INCI7300.1.p1  ORF type:complete len:104 (+),score=11.47 INCI7300.1:295-606(+)